jgi:O-antigen ligase/tetratricopeptide (TPR) repeat protein
MDKIISVFFLGFGIICLFFTRLIIDPTLTPRLLALSIFVVIGLSAFVIYNKKISINFLSLLYFIFVLFVFLSIFWSQNTALSIIEASKYFLYFIFFIFFQKLLSTDEDDVHLKMTKTLIFIFFLTLIPLVIDVAQLTNFSREQLYSISVSNGHKNLYSSFLFLCSVLIFFGYKTLNEKWKKVAITVLVSQFLIVLFLLSRSVILAYLIFAFVFFCLFRLKNRNVPMKIKSIVFLAIICLSFLNVLIIWFLPAILSSDLMSQILKYNFTDLSTLSERIKVWNRTYEIFWNNPYFGVGGNNWQLFFPFKSLPEIYRVTDLNVTFQRPHNDFLWNLSEYGIVGFNLYYGMIILILISLLFLEFKKENIILFSGILGYLCISFFDFPRERIEHNLLLNVLFALSIIAITRNFKFMKDKNLRYKYLNHLFLGVSLFTFSVAYFNFRGEYFTKKIYEAKNNQNNPNVVYLSDMAVSYCYNLDPTSVPIHWYRGNANANMNLYSDALSDFRIALQNTPYNHYVLNDLGSAFFMINQIDSAKYYYQKSAQINPRFDEPKLNMIAILLNENNYEDANKWNDSIYHDSERRSYYIKLLNKHKAP